MAATIEEDGLHTGPVPLGATRPPMVPFVGLPFSAAVPLVVAAAEVQMAVTGLQGVAYALVLLATVGLPLRVWVSYDWYAIENVALWLRTMGPALDATRWGGSTASHAPLLPKWLARETRGMPAHGTLARV